MRILYIDKSDNKYRTAVEAAEIVYASYEDDLDPDDDTLFASSGGLYLITADDDEIMVPGLSESTCNSIVVSLYTDGMADLSRYDSYLNP